GEPALTGKYPSYDVYETADGEYLTLAAIEPKFWGAFCEKVGREHLIADHLSNDEETREEVREEIAEVIGSKTLDDWLDDFDASDVPVGPVRSLSEAVEDPQTEARGLIERAGEVPRIGFPALSSEGEFGGDENVPEQGEHTEELLGEVGYTDEEIQKMEEEGAI
ncbi:MAG: CoA transferase, partial [Halobacteria archaeon]|nr:CoA transferase [Halobacteria archaeon]